MESRIKLPESSLKSQFCCYVDKMPPYYYFAITHLYPFILVKAKLHLPKSNKYKLSMNCGDVQKDR